ncbi:hypothetical protein [Nonomuraea endophytica]|uniref:Septum formation initiator n=1 Tax=Nonomuraea endophytica TaxID=714136 RepID=A0A7W8EI91_9ACTN|nr:hypothetical protein [Nonomuraea endophytica]MBB5080303.1 hypothetical protein [Nonomuraea endophytica]
MKRLMLAWAVVALAAAGAAVAVLGLLGGVLTGQSGNVMTQAEARSALATLPSGTSTGAATPAPTGGGKVIRTAGGTVIATCTAAQVSLRNWSPFQGYSVDDPEPGPAPSLTVEFDREEGEDVEVVVRCQNGRPVI